jgi:hypothetical protein
MRLVRPPALALILLATASIATSSLAAAPPAAGAEPEPPRPCLDRFRELVGAPLRYRPRALIATLPDPLDSPFAREFDALFLAFQRAMAEKGLVQDAACLTWSRQPGGEEASHRETPSVVLFRRDADLADPDSRGEVYTVLLVGELPHTGVRSQAMARALAWVARDGSFGAGGEAGEEDEEPLRVLGPTFSGSGRSLAVALAAAAAPGVDQEPPTPPRRLEIRSGTATSGSLAAVLESVLGPEVSFRSHGTASHHLQRCVWNRLVPERLGLDTRWGVRLGLGDDCEPAGKGRDNGRVALLVESSAYGSDFEGFHLVPFPTHIGALREAYRAIGPSLRGADSAAEARISPPRSPSSPRRRRSRGCRRSATRRR